MQCVTQAVSINDRKPMSKPSDSPANLLQLPHFDADALKKLKRRKINNLKGAGWAEQHAGRVRACCSYSTDRHYPALCTWLTTQGHAQRADMPVV